MDNLKLKKIQTKNVSKFSMPTYTTTHQNINAEIKAGRVWDGGRKED
jgi:hypothetical protein